MKLRIIAEIGVNHNGSVHLAREMLHAAAAAGANSVKFQLFDPTAVARSHAPVAQYQRASGKDDQRSLLEGLCLPRGSLEELVGLGLRLGVDVFATAFDLASLSECIESGVRTLKVPSGELNNPFLLEAIASANLPVLCSTGMSNLADVEWAVDILQDGGAADVTLLHCTSAYPAPSAESNIRAIRTLGEAFGLPVGFSDHTIGNVSSVAAVALGAVVIEKHFTTDRDLAGPDQRASCDPVQFASLVEDLTSAAECLGTGRKIVAPAEVSTQQVARRSITYSRDLSAGVVLARSDLSALRPADGLDPRHLDLVVGRRLRRDVFASELVNVSDLD